MIPADDYTCAMCGETYTRTVSDEEALEETRLLFGEHKPEGLAIICDDCFQKIHPERN